MRAHELLIVHSNVRSLLAKITKLREYANNYNPDIIAVTETWLKPTIQTSTIEITNYTFFRNDRVQHAGGVGIYVKNTITAHFMASDNSVEQLWVKLNIGSYVLVIGTVYNPQRRFYEEFLNALHNSLLDASVTSENILILGDFNIDYSKLEKATSDLISLCENFELSQIINEPTREDAILDLILSSKTNCLLESGTVPSTKLSDHDMTFCKLKISSYKPSQFFKTYRCFRNFNFNNFNNELKTILWDNIYGYADIDSKIEFFNETLLALFSKHAPIRTSRISKPPAPWLNDHLKFLMQQRDYTYNIYKRSKTELNRQQYNQLRNEVTKACRKEKKKYFDKLTKNKDVKTLWNDLKKNVMRNKKTSGLSTHLCNVELINDFFVNSVPNVNQNNNNFFNNYFVNNRTNARLNFHTVSENDILNIISSIKSNSAGHDGITIYMIKLCVPHLLPVISHIINHCITFSVFPDCWKKANVIPLQKTRNPTEFKDLRPISILPVLSKILEKIIDNQLRHHFNQNNLIPNIQSGFRPGYGCSAALLKITDDIFHNLDNKLATILVLLDFSKAFDTVDHEILLEILKSCGLTPHAITFFQQYLTNRQQAVTYQERKSSYLTLNAGVPQGSILSPILFALYTSTFSNYLKFTSCHFYADDTQLYLSFAPSNAAEACQKINEDLKSLSSIASAFHLKLNPNKSKAMLFCNHYFRDILLNEINLRVDGIQVKICDEARNLGLSMDSDLRFNSHVNACVKKGFQNLRIIFQNREFLNIHLKKMLCESLVLSHCNYCDVVYGPCINSNDIRKIQRLQNACLRLIYGVPRTIHKISDKLIDANWLNMSNRRFLHSTIFYHKLTLIKIPTYLHERISYRTDVHHLNLRHRGLLSIPLHRTSTFKRSFSYTIASYLNEIPNHLKSLSINNFKKAMLSFLHKKQLTQIL